MTDMIEKVARAICPDWWHDDGFLSNGVYSLDNYPGQHLNYRERSLQQARAAIEAMREPTESMVDAAMNYGWQPSPLNIGYDEAWRAMIDSVLGNGQTAVKD